MSAQRTPRGSGRAVVALVLLAAAAAALAAGTRPSFDAYGWLDWGRMTLHGGLDTNAAPSWKPLPWLFTVVFGLLGRGPELWLWMVTVTFVSFAGLGWAARLTFALSTAPGGASAAAGTEAAAARTEATSSGLGLGSASAGKVSRAGAEQPSPHRRPGRGSSGPRTRHRRLAGSAAAALAVLAVLAIHDEYPFGYLHYVLSSQSDPMIVAFMLGAADGWRRGRPRAAFGLLVLAALGRPEAWPFLLAAGVWLWRARPGFRWAVIAGCAAVALLWFGIPALTSRSWFVAADNAGASGYAPHGDALHRAITVLGRLVFQVPWAIWAGAAGALPLAVWRRDRAVLGLAGGAVLWIAIEVAFGVHGWPALGRYMFEPSAVVIVIGASLAGRLLAGDALSLAATGRRERGHGAEIGGGLVALSVILWTTPALVGAGRREARDLRSQHARTAQLDALTRTIDRLGGPARLRSCGEVISAGPTHGTPGRRSVGLGGQTALAFDVGENVNRVGYIFPQPGHPWNPIVVFHPHVRDDGWTVRALRQTAPGCRGLGVAGLATGDRSGEPGASTR